MKLLDKQLAITARRIIYNSLGFFDYITGAKSRVFVFCYHSVGNDKWRYGVSYLELEKQISYLLKNYKPARLVDIYNDIKGTKIIKEPSFVITFDDGYEDILQTVQLFKKLNIYPTVFVLGDPKRINRDELDNNRKVLTKKQIAYLKKSGWDIQSHGTSHEYLPQTKKTLRSEIGESKKLIAKNYGVKVNYFAYPKGGYTDSVIKEIKSANFDMALSMDSGQINQNTNIYAVPRVGVDRSHNFSEFKVLFSPSVIRFRSIYKPVDSFIDRIKHL